MLAARVVDAVREGLFSVYTVETVDDALCILTDCNTGSQLADGSYPAGSLNEKIVMQLRQFAQCAINAAE
jgi:hypothetical protein